MLMFAIIRRKECANTYMYECIYQMRKIKSGKKKIWTKKKQLKILKGNKNRKNQEKIKKKTKI